MHNDGVVFEKVVFKCSLNLSLNPACRYSAGCNRLQKTKAVYLLHLFEGRGRRGSVIECVEHL